MGKDIRTILVKDGKSPELYLPLINLFKKKFKPMSIKEVSEQVGLSYSITKQRLHKLERLGMVERMKSGVYGLPEFTGDYVVHPPSSKSVFINGAIRKIKHSNTIVFHIYNSAFTKKCGNKFCLVEQKNQREFVVRAANQFVGRKIHPLKRGGSFAVITRKLLTSGFEKLSNKSVPIRIEIYPEEWRISIDEIFGTETIEEGELAKELVKFGKISKPRRTWEIKADLIFESNNMRVPIEITKVFSDRPGKRSDIKSYEILGRLYYGIKCFLIFKTPMFIILHECWKDTGWLNREKEFLENKHVYILYTNFKDKWPKEISVQILDKLANYRESKTTRLGSE